MSVDPNSYTDKILPPVESRLTRSSLKWLLAFWFGLLVAAAGFLTSLPFAG